MYKQMNSCNVELHRKLRLVKTVIIYATTVNCFISPRIAHATTSWLSKHNHIVNDHGLSTPTIIKLSFNLLPYTLIIMQYMPVVRLKTVAAAFDYPNNTLLCLLSPNRETRGHVSHTQPIPSLSNIPTKSCGNDTNTRSCGQKGGACQ